MQKTGAMGIETLYGRADAMNKAESFESATEEERPQMERIKVARNRPIKLMSNTKLNSIVLGINKSLL